MLRPTLTVQAVHDVTPHLLQRYDLRAVMVDLDDTLVASGKDELNGDFRTWVESLHGADIPILILSNGHKTRVGHWAKTLEVQGLHLVGKPFPYGFRRGLRVLGTGAEETAMIGDQLFTDVLGANLLGMTSILVTPLSPGGLVHTRLARRVERFILGISGGGRDRSIDR